MGVKWLSTTTAVLTSCAIFALAGCATSPQTATARQARAAQQSGTKVSSPRQRALADAAYILASFAAPPGARRLSRAPAADGGVLGRSEIPGLPFQVDLTSWWQVPGQPQSVLGWEQAHLPRQFTPGGGSAGASRVRDREFWLPAVPGVLAQRTMVVTAVAAGEGQTVVRVDGWVMWIPARPAAERVPASARVISVEVVPGNKPGGAPLPGPVVITAPGRVRRITAFVDGLPLAPFLPPSCPEFSPGAVRVTFMARIGGPPLAVFTTELMSCYSEFTVNGKPQPELDRTAARQLLALAGLRRPPLAV
jgi:hypothetical protein